MMVLCRYLFPKLCSNTFLLNRKDAYHFSKVSMQQRRNLHIDFIHLQNYESKILINPYMVVLFFNNTFSSISPLSFVTNILHNIGLYQSTFGSNMDKLNRWLKLDLTAWSRGNPYVFYKLASYEVNRTKTYNY